MLKDAESLGAKKNYGCTFHSGLKRCNFEQLAEQTHK